eukprot:306020-Rhodomonas_salina.1
MPPTGSTMAICVNSGPLRLTWGERPGRGQAARRTSVRRGRTAVTRTLFAGTRTGASRARARPGMRETACSAKTSTSAQLTLRAAEKR